MDLSIECLDSLEAPLSNEGWWAIGFAAGVAVGVLIT